MNLTLEEKQSLDRGEPVSVRVDETECVVLRRDVYERIQNIVNVVYDDSPWTVEEMDLLAAEAAERLDRAERIE